MKPDDAAIEALRKTQSHEGGVVRFHHLSGGLEKYVLTPWKTKIGDRVHVRDIIASIETTDLVLEIEVFEDGVISELGYRVGDTIPDGAIIARLASTSQREPNQPAQRNASTGSVSNFESPAPRG